MALTKVNVANIVEGILPVANGGTGTSTGAAAGGSNTQVQYNSSGAFAGSSSFVFDGTNVGIGGASGGARLQLTGTTNGASRIDLVNSTGSVTANYGAATDGTAVLKTVSASPLVFGVTDTERMRIDTSGNVGIGTTSTFANSLLNVAQGVAARNQSTTTPFFQLYNANAGTDLKTWRWGNDNSGNMFFQTVNDAYSSATNRLFIDPNGNVGIGLSSPNAKLEVSLPASTSAVVARFTSPTYETIEIGAGLSNYIGTVSTSPLIFRTNSTTRFQIGGSGQLGIGGATYGTAGQVLTSGGSGAAPTWSTPASGQYQYSLATYATAYNSSGSPLVWNSNGSLTWTAPTGVTKVKVTVIAGGGGAQNATGAWGGYGGQAIGVYTVTPSTAYSITVGNGGAGTTGGSTSNGTTGGSSSFSTLISATGGQGGQYNGGSALYGTTGAGTNGNIMNQVNITYYSSSGYSINIGSMIGGYSQTSSAGPTGSSAVPWTISLGVSPGTGGGQGGAGGVGGLVLIEYIG